MAELSSIEVMVLVKEINTRLKGMYVNNVYSLGESQIIKLRDREKECFLIVSPSCGSWISEKISQREETTAFTSQLRKLVERKKLEGATQVNFDRVFCFHFNEDTRLYLELPRPGNIVVTDSEDTIALCLREYVTSRREIRKGRKYTPPVQGRKPVTSLSLEDFLLILSKESKIGEAIGKYVALPRKYITEILERNGLRHTDQISDAQKVNELYQTMQQIISEAQEDTFPSVYSIGGEMEVYSIKLANHEPEMRAKSISEICDTLFLPLLYPEHEEAEQLERKKTIEKLLSELESSKEIEERLMAAALSVSQASTVEQAREIIEKNSLDFSNYQASSPAAIASRLFESAKLMRSKQESIEQAIAKLRKEKPRLERKRLIELGKKSREWYEKFRWFITSGGKLAIGGRDAATNEQIVRKYMESNDTVFHADVHGSPFFLLKNGREQKEQEVIEVATATACFSSAWKVGLVTADSYWVFPEQVSLSAPSGQYLERGSFLIKGKKNYVRKLVLQLAVGLLSDGRVFSGPESAVSMQTKNYFVIEPYRQKNTEVAKKIAKEFSNLGFRISVDDVMRVLPSGGCRIVRKKVDTSKQ